MNAAACLNAFTPGPTATPTITFTATRTPTLTPSRTLSPTRTPTSPPIGIPAISSPSSNQVINVSGVTFAWSAVTNATSYDLQILNTANSATIFSGSLTGNAATSTLIVLPNNGAYQFKVRACVNASCGTYATRNFSISLVAPVGTPSITFPAPGAVLTDSIQTLSWSAVGNGGSPFQVFYEVELTNLGTNLPELRITEADPTVSTVTKLHSGTYRVRVRACQTTCGAYSTPVDFSAELPAQPSSAPAITNTSLNGSDLTVTWSSVAGAEWYQVLVVQLPPAGPGRRRADRGGARGGGHQHGVADSQRRGERDRGGVHR
ncbi:MAG: fibronectin type III domain-containing protein [Candidatus Binatia bacterium]